MNLSDARVVGVTALTSAAVALVTVSVYEGQAKLSSAGQTVIVQPGTPYQIVPGQPPAPPREEVKLTVGGGPPVHAASDEAELVVPLAERIVIHDPDGRINVAVDPRCPSNPGLLWANTQHAPLVTGSYAFAHTCDGIEHRGEIDVVDDAGDDVVLKPKRDQAWKVPLTVLGAGVPAPAHVTVEGFALKPSDQPYWVAEITPKHPGLFSVRIDGKDANVHYYVRREPAKNGTTTRPPKDRLASANEFERLMKQAEPALVPCVKKWTTGAVVGVAVDGDGKVTKAWTTFSDPATDACLQRELRKLSFKTDGLPLKGTYHLDPPCNADDLLAAGSTAMARGDSATAAKQYKKAYDCKADIHTLQLTFMAACNAHDLELARAFWKRMDPSAQTHLLQMCVREHISQDMLNE